MIKDGAGGTLSKIIPNMHVLCCAALSHLSCVQLFCDPVDCSPPGSSVHRILLTRILRWIATPSSRGSSWLRDQTCISCIAGRVYDWATGAAKSLYSCPTLCDPIDGSPPGSSVPGTLQARTLEWVAISFSNAWKWKVKVKSLSCVRLFCDPLDCSLPGSCVHGIPPQYSPEYWSGLPFPLTEPLAKYSKHAYSF